VQVMQGFPLTAMVKKAMVKKLARPKHHTEASLDLDDMVTIL
jgi:hypothetical protein